MRLYAATPLRRSLQAAADLAVLAWVLLWVVIGRWVFALVMTLAAPADPLRSAGRGLTDRMTDIADRVVRIPLVGEELDGPFTGAAGVGGDLVQAGEALESSARTVAWVVSLLSAGTPILLVVLAWALARWAWVRRAGVLAAGVDTPGGQQLMALRALVRQHPSRLHRLFPDPVAAYASGDPQVWRTLADLELARVGLRGPARRAPDLRRWDDGGMKTIIIALLVLWLVFSVLGAVIEGLMWLLWVGILLFVATAAWGLIAGRRR